MIVPFLMPSYKRERERQRGGREGEEREGERRKERGRDEAERERVIRVREWVSARACECMREYVRE